MFVCLNKVTCARMFNYAQEYWQDEIKALEKQLKNATQQEYQALNRKIDWMRKTEMAVVVSQEQNEIQTFRKLSGRTFTVKRYICSAEGAARR